MTKLYLTLGIILQILHMCTIKDLFNYCDEQNIKIKKVIGVNEDKISLIKKK